MNIEADLKIQKGDFKLNANVCIQKSGITAIFGPSGCGKTSILRALTGLDQHTGCSISFNKNVWQDKDTFIPTHKRRIGYISQEYSLFPHLCVKENIKYGYKRATESNHFIQFEELITLLDLEPFLSRNPDSLSGGQKQRVAIARSIAAAPQLLVMDEPLSNLDNEGKSEIINFIKNLHEKFEIPILYVTHSIREIASLTDHVILIKNGQMGPPNSTIEVLTDTKLNIAHDPEAVSILEAEVFKHDNDFSLTELKADNINFSLSGIKKSPGDKVRILIAARDCSISLNEQNDSSIMNCFPATVKSITVENDSEVLVKLSAGKHSILSRITKKSSSKLNLEEGKNVFVQVKSVALIS